MQRVAVVTGGTRGIGRSIVAQLSSANYVVWTCARRVSEQQRQDGPHGVRMRECDVANDDSVSRFAAEVLSAHRRIDVLVNNAGVSIIRNGKRTLTHELTMEQWCDVLNINLTGAYRMCRAFVGSMVEYRHGTIINVSSASARMGGIAASVDYISSKAGLIGLTKGLAFELGQFGIRAVAICPGRIATDMLTGTGASEGWARHHVPLGRLGDAADVAKLVAFLASDEAGYITGATIDCNGGWIIT
jgi:3-oxoacyl-[acyl-carrier protein] reductase